MLQPFKIQIGLNTRIYRPPYSLVQSYFTNSLPYDDNVSSELAHAFGYLHPQYRNKVRDKFYFHDWGAKDNRTLLLRQFFLDLELTDTDANKVYHKFLFYELALGNTAIIQPNVEKIIRSRTIKESLKNAVGVINDWESVISKILNIHQSTTLDVIQKMIAEIIYLIRTKPTIVTDDYLYHKTFPILSSFDINNFVEQDENFVRAYFKFLLQMNYLRSAALIIRLTNLSYLMDEVYSPAKIYLFKSLFDVPYIDCCHSDLARTLVNDYMQSNIYEANIFSNRFILGTDFGRSFTELSDEVFHRHQMPDNCIYIVTTNSKYLNELLPALFSSPPSSADIATYQNENEYYNLPVLSFVLDILYKFPLEPSDDIRNHIFKQNPKQLNSNQGNLFRSAKCLYLMLYADFVEFTDGVSLENAIENKSMTFLSQVSTREFRLLDATMQSSIISDFVKEQLRPLHTHLQSRYVTSELTLLEHALITHLLH